MTSRLLSKQLYIAYLAQQMADMEGGTIPLQALLYRLLAKRLRQAAAGLPESSLAGRSSASDRQVAEMLEVRYFDNHGRFRGRDARASCAHADALFERLRRGPVPPRTTTKAPDA